MNRLGQALAALGASIGVNAVAMASAQSGDGGAYRIILLPTITLVRLVGADSEAAWILTAWPVSLLLWAAAFYGLMRLASRLTRSRAESSRQSPSS